MKVAIVGTYPAETYKKFEEHFAGNPEIFCIDVYYFCQNTISLDQI